MDNVVNAVSESNLANHCGHFTINGMKHVLKNAPVESNANLATNSQAEMSLHQELNPVILKFIIK